MLLLKDLYQLKTTLLLTASISSPIFMYWDAFDDLYDNQDEFYELQKLLYENIDNNFFTNKKDYNDYFCKIKYNKETNNLESSTLDAFIKLMISFYAISKLFYPLINKTTSNLLETLFDNFQKCSNKDDIHKIHKELQRVILKDRLLTKYKNLILYQDPVIKTYNPSKTNKSKLDRLVKRSLENRDKSSIDEYSQKGFLPVCTFNKDLNKLEDNVADFKTNRNITHKFRDKELNKHFGVVKVNSTVKKDVFDLLTSSHLMRLYWNDKRALSYNNQPEKVAGRLYRIIQKSRDQEDPQIAAIKKEISLLTENMHTMTDIKLRKYNQLKNDLIQLEAPKDNLLKLTKLEITKIVRESFELSIYSD
jgi:hypothetical protein